MKKYCFHFVGINGISMSGIAMMLADLGHKITGSDLAKPIFDKQFDSKNIKYFTGHNATNISNECDAVIYSSAIPENNPELKQAKKYQIPTIKRSVFIQQLIDGKWGGQKGKVIAVSGMHGKTTTTALLSLAMIEAGLDPNVLIGGQINEFNNLNYRLGKGEWWVIEACEYDRSFLDFNPNIIIITNIEAEHLDCYQGGLPEIKETFLKFINKLPNDGLLVFNEDDKNIASIKNKIKKDIVSFGAGEKADFQIKNYQVNNNGKAQFTIQSAAGKVAPLPYLQTINLPGVFNAANLVASLAVLVKYFKLKQLNREAKTWSNFIGVHRRFEYLGEIKGALVFDDYAHHPTEVRSTIESASRLFPKKSIIVVFQPHQYSRTKELLEEFSRSFEAADLVIMPDIYEVAGRDEEKSISSRDVVEAIKNQGQKAVYLPTFEKVVEYLSQNISDNKVIITMGAGPIDSVAKKLIEENSK